METDNRVENDVARDRILIQLELGRRENED